MAARFNRVLLLAVPAVLALLCVFAPRVARAQDTYPSRPIKLVIPLATGGNVDLLARVIAEKMTASLGQPVLVESKPGANTVLATTAVAAARPDGYTLLFTISGLVQNLVLQKSPSYSLADFAPVSMVARAVTSSAKG